MSGYSTLVRATHLVTNAAWFGGSLMGAVALNPAAREGDDSREQAEIADEGWTRWGPVQGAAIGLHLLSGIAILADNRRRGSPPTGRPRPPSSPRPPSPAPPCWPALRPTGSAPSWATPRRMPTTTPAPRRSRSLASTMRWLQWATPATTAGILVLDAFLGEQQRGEAGLLDRPTRALDLRRRKG